MSVWSKFVGVAKLFYPQYPSAANMDEAGEYFCREQAKANLRGDDFMREHYRWCRKAMRELIYDPLDPGKL